MEEEVYRHPRLDKAALDALGIRSNAKGAARLAGHLAALLATGALLWVVLGTWWAVPATMLHGAALIFVFAPLHETIHRTAFRSRALNDAVAYVCGAILVLPPEFFRYFHFAHHRHTQDPARDPELEGPKPANFRAWALHVSGLPVWRWHIAQLVRHAAGRVNEAYIPARGRPAIVREARTLLALYAAVAIAAIAAATPAPLYLWIVPAIAGQPLLRIFLLAEHTLCPLVPDMLANTRTTLTNARVRYFTWNMPYHAEHHAFPALPFHALPAAHRALAGDLKVTATGYIAVQRELLASFK